MMFGSTEKFWRTAVPNLVISAILVVLVGGCGASKPPEKSPDEIEKARIEHGETMKRELEEG